MRPSLLLSAFLLSSPGFALNPVEVPQQQTQATVKKGTVKEKSGEGMPGVMIHAKDKAGNTLAYTTSKQGGDFRLSIPAGATPTALTFSCLGFKTVTIPLGDFKTGSVVTMEEDAFELKEVTVRVPPVKSQGDTLTYDVASFKTAADRSIEDVIKKLPGINVTEEGRIYYNGEAINKFYIEGLDMLSGRYALATKNIAANDVQSVNVYENHQAKRVLKDINFSDKAALNLKLKKKRMLKPIGYLKAGGGIDDNKDALWLGEAFSMLVSPKTQMLATVKANEAGISYFNETRSLTEGEYSDATYAAGIYPDTPFGSAKIPTMRYYDNRSISASANSLSKIGKFTDIKVTADYADESNSYDNHQMIVYADGAADQAVFREDARNSPHKRKVKFRASLENNADQRYISNNLSFRGDFNAGRYVVADGATVHQKTLTRDFDVSNRFSGIFKISKSVVDFSSYLRFATTPLNRISAYDDNDRILSQNVKGTNFFTREQAGYTWVINTRSSLGLTARFELARNTFISEALIPSGMAGNDIAALDAALVVEPKYENKISNHVTVTLSVPLRASWLRVDNKTDGSRSPYDRFEADFRAMIAYRAPFNLRTSLTAGRSSGHGGLSDFIDHPLYTTFRNRYTPGSGKLSIRDSYYTNLTASHRNAMAGIFSSASFLYRHSSSNRLSGINAGDGVVESSFSNIKNRSDMLNTDFSVSKKWYDTSTIVTIDGNFQRLKKEVIRQQKVRNLLTYIYTAHGNINSSPIGNLLIMDLDCRWSLLHQKAQGITEDTKELTLSLSLSTFPIKQLELYAKGYLNRSDLAHDRAKTCMFIDCGVRYSIRSFDIELSGRNLTNRKAYAYSYLLDSDLYSYSFSLRPIEALLTLKYSF